MSKLQSIDSLMERDAQAAYDSLCRYKKQMMEEDSPRKVEMCYRLLTAKAQNKLYLEMPNDSVFQEVVDYYDSKGTSNEKMEAHYLMGCIFRDQKEAPKAMMSYKKAVECADTLSKDCDFKTLFRNYGQMAYLYRQQQLHVEAIKAYMDLGKYAYKANCVSDYIGAYQTIVFEYYGIGDTIKTIQMADRYIQLCQKYGMKREAASVYPVLIYICLQRSRYNEARKYMDVFESQLKIFDKFGIKKGYEHYYKAKGMYYLGINSMDSAEYYFRKLYTSGFRYEAAKGLLSLYSKYQKTDSIVKYSILSEREIDCILNNNQAKAVSQASSLYNYARLQKEIDSKIVQATKVKYSIAIFSLCFLVICIYVYGQYKKNQRAKNEEIKRINLEFNNIAKDLIHAREDLNHLLRNEKEFKEKKQTEIQKLQAQIKKYEKDNDKLAQGR